MNESKHFINGEFCASASGNNFPNYNPATGEQVGIINDGDEYEVDRAVQAARAALQGEWGEMTLNDRVELLCKAADRITERFDEFLEAECLDTGKPYSLASHIDIPRGAANFKVFADMIKNVSSESFATPTPDGTGALNYAVHKPKGVIGVICPWNLPLLLMTWKVAPALACGNTVVVKPSDETNLTTVLLGEVMNEVGMPKGVFNVVLGRGATAGAALTRHPDVDALTFTGSTATGELLMKAAAVGVRDCSLELGGKNAGVVFADCDMDKAIEGTLRSCFANCGQVCLGTERLYVERSIFDEFVARLKEGAEQLVLGDPANPDTNLGPLISKKHQEKVLSYFKKAADDGANLVTGGGIPAMPSDLAGGYWIQPTLWTGLPESAAVVQEEIFGPVSHITPFDTEEEAIALANDSKYGLAAALWTENLSRGLRVADKLEAGIVWVNSWFLRDLRTPFGGSKQSGIGREGGVHSLEFYTELKNICIKL
jgi:aminomuconate-semialdehyde/2-hydroxymuconate-6-semialdehyde dehydrogenase